MTRHLKSSLAPSLALALAASLAACGSGGGSSGGGGVAFAPPPPITPTATIGAPALAVAPNAGLFPQASVGGPTMQAHPITVFPLLQSVVSITSAGLAADTATMNGGATLAFNATGTAGNDSYQIDIANPAIGISNAHLMYDWCGYCASVGTKTVDVSVPDPATSGLGWTTYGMWAVREHSGAPTSTHAAFVTGYQTPAGSVPTSGTATYAGSVVGLVFRPQAGQPNGIGSSQLRGNATLQANFGSGAITGSLTNMMAGLLSWNSVSLLGAISGGQFSGTSAATSAPGNSWSLGGSAAGTFAGLFFGPTAEELGAVWTLSDGTGAAIGSIGATTSPPSPWDY